MKRSIAGVARWAGSIFATKGRHVGFDANDRLDIVGLACVVKFDGPVHDTMI